MRDWQGMKEASGSLVCALMLGTDLAGRDESLGIVLHSGPPEVLSQQCQGAPYPGVTSQAGGVSQLENLRVETGRDKQTVNGTGTGGRVIRMGAFYHVNYFPTLPHR